MGRRRYRVPLLPRSGLQAVEVWWDPAQGAFVCSVHVSKHDIRLETYPQLRDVIFYSSRTAPLSDALLRALLRDRAAAPAHTSSPTRTTR
jgi:hypothetical protein